MIFVKLSPIRRASARSNRSKSLPRRMQGLKKLLDSDSEAVAILAADNLGKWKTGFQLMFVITALVHLTFSPIDVENVLVRLLQYLSNPEHWLIPISLWSAVVLTVVSGLSYFWSSRDMILDRE